MKKGIKRIISAFLVAVMIVCAAPLSGFVGLDFDFGRLDFTTKSSAFDSSGSCGENVTYTFDEDSGLLTISGTGDMKNYSLSDSPFYNNNAIKSVVINKGVTSIGDSVFRFCRGLTSISIPDSVTSIGESAFYYCEDLITIIIPDGVTKIDNSAFISCSKLATINIPDSVTYLGNDIFRNCSSLESITVDEKNTVYDSRENCNAIIKTENNELIYGCKATVIPDSVTSIGDYAFYECSGLTSIYIPDSVTSIGEYAFYGCSGLTNISIPGSVTSISKSVFGYCSGLTSINIPNSVTDICDSAFSGCKGLTSINIPNSVTSIGNYAFENCIGLTNLSIPNSVTKIGSYAFDYCSGLTSIRISDRVTSIGNYAFSYCNSLASITVDENNTVYDSRENCNAIIKTESNKLIYGCKSSAIPDSVTSIADSAFSNCSGLTNINISNSVTSIGNNAFNGCSELISVSLADGVTSIGKKAFYNCKVLETLNIPDSVTYIDDYAFYGCRSLTKIDIPDSVTYMGNYVFAECYNINSINMSDNITSIGDYAFNQCTDLTEITIPDGVTSIGKYAFSQCTNLTKISIPDSVTSIGDHAFRICSNLKSIKLPDGIKYIRDATFECCYSLTSILIPNSVTNIERNAFYFCNNLESIILPENIEVIGDYAFAYCSKILITDYPKNLKTIGREVFFGCTRINGFSGTISCGVKALCGGIIAAINNNLCKISVKDTLIEQLEKLYIPTDIDVIIDNAFARCTALKEVTIGNNIKSIGSNAFENCPLETVCFIGTKAEWDEVCGKNINLSSAEVIFVDYSCGEELSAKFFLNSSTLTISGSGRMEDYSSADDMPWYGIKDSIKTVVFDGEPTSIGDFAFSGLTALENIEIPESVTSIGASAFKDCTALKTVNLPDGITSIGEKAFYNTAIYNDPASYNGNKVLYLGDNRYLIAYGKQLNGQRFNGIVNPDTVLIADGAFRSADCETVQLNEGLKYIGREAFADSSVKTVYFPESVEACSNDIFNGCGSLTVNYGSSVSDWYRKDIFLPENSVVYFTAKTEDGKVSVIYCSDDLPQDIGDISIDENSPGVTTRILEKEGSMTGNELKMSDHTFSMEFYDSFEPIDITLKNKKGEIQPKAGRSVRVKIKAPDFVREKILEILDFHGDFDELKINKDGFFLNGNKQYLLENRKDEIINKIFIFHFYNGGEYMGKKYDTITFKDNLELENGYLTFSVSHFSEFSFFTSPFGFIEKEINLDIGEAKKLDYIRVDDQKTIRFESSKPSVATVDGNGVVTAQKSGEAVITAYYDGVEVGSCKVTVNDLKIIFGTKNETPRLDYLTTAYFFCQAENLPEGATVHWYIDGHEYAEGETCTVKNITENFAICVKVLDKNGNVLDQTNSLTVKVKTGFFDKLLGYFRKLFGTLKTVRFS